MRDEDEQDALWQRALARARFADWLLKRLASATDAVKAALKRERER